MNSIDGLDGRVDGQALVVRRLCRRIVSGRGPGREGEQQTCVIEAAQGMSLARVEYDQRSGVALHRLSRSFDRNPAGDHLHDRALADMMIAHRLPAAKVEHNEPALGRREQDARILVTGRRHACRFGSRLARDALFG